MDPFAALGATAAIAQLIEQGISLVNGARQIHKSAFGSTAENRTLGAVIQELKTLSERMVSKKPRHEQSDAERSLSNVASECQILSEKILGLLEKMKAKDRSSFRQSAVAALRSAWNDKEKRELVEQVEKCRSMMHTQLTVILGSSTVLRLDNMIKTGTSNADELASLRKNVDALRSGVKLTEIGHDVEQQLCKLLDISNTAMNAVSQYRILNSLCFNEMNKRFDTVGKANPETFEWIFHEEPKEIDAEEKGNREEPNDGESETKKTADHGSEEEEEDVETKKVGGKDAESGETSVEEPKAEEEENDKRDDEERERGNEERKNENRENEESKNEVREIRYPRPPRIVPGPRGPKGAIRKIDKKTLEKRALFRRWLVSGTGIFNISGKLGSGKSTLMKFLCNDSRCTDLLNMWAAGRQLVVAKFFFWKPGTEMETSINGMVRTLLYDVLKQCPDLISLVFPDQWKEVQDLPWQANVVFRLNKDETDRAFYRLLECRNSGKRRCFYLFIDGLDEFNGAGRQDYGDLVDVLWTWNQCTPKDPQRCEDIKICVSSREENAFMESFSAPKRLRLQDLNRIDLVRFIDERLTSHKLFPTLEFTKDTNKEEFVNQIADQADGVFLWATLVMISLRKGLDDGENLLELQDTLNSTPSDIKILFGSLISKIDEKDRQQSARTFSILVTLWKHCHNDRMALFAYSFLDELGKDPEYAFKLPVGPRISEKEVTQRVDRARKKLIGRCRGLVEIRDRAPWGNGPLVLAKALEHELTVVHRSIHEFLEIPENREWMTQYLENFSPVETICNSIIATIKRFGPLEPLNSFPSTECIEVMHFHSNLLQTVQCVRGEPDFGIQLRIITELGKLLPRPQAEDTLIVPSFDHVAPHRVSGFHVQPMVYFGIQNPKWGSDRLHFLSICNLAAHAGLFEYITWAFEPPRNHTYEPWEIVGLIEVWIQTGDLSTYAFIESIFKQGLSPNMTTTRSGSPILANIPEEASLSIWELFLNEKLPGLFGISRNVLPSTSVIEILLKYGADPRILLSTTLPEKTDKYFEADYGRVDVIISFSPSSNSQQITKMFLPSELESHCLRTFGGKATLRDLFEFVLKENDGKSANYPYMQGCSEVLKRCLVLIDRNLDLIKKPPITLEDEPSVSTEEEKSIPAPENNKPPLNSLFERGEAEEKKQWLLDQTKTSNTSGDSQAKKSIGVEETQIFLAKVMRSPFAPFALGILITYLYFCFVTK